MVSLKRLTFKNLGASILFVLLLTTIQCATKATSPPNLPDNILGIKPGMSKDDAEKRLRDIGKFSRDEVKRQQVWSLRDDPHFGYVGIGYDKENQVQYITAIAKIKGGQLMRFTEVGDIKAAKEEIAGANHRYIWEVPAREGGFPYSVIAQGNNADYLSLFTLVKPEDKNEEEEEERGEKEERK